MDRRDETLDFSVLPDVSSQHPELKGQELLYAAHMQARENAFHSIFGQTEPPNTIRTVADANLMINWPGGGVYTFPPQTWSRVWHHVTHGLAQPMDDPIPSDTVPSDDEGEPVSGWGIELVISTPDNNHWAPDVLVNLVKYLLFQENSRVILPGDRLPCNGPIVRGTDSKIRHVIAVRSPEYPSNVHLPAGFCWLVHLVGATDDEIAFAARWGPGLGGTQILEEVFLHYGVGTTTDPSRASLTDQDGFSTVWAATQARLEARWRANGWDGEGKSS